MRLLTTIFLIISTAALSYWCYRDHQERQQVSTFDKNGAIPSGKSLFDNPQLLDRQSITISQKGGVEHIFHLNRNSLWECISPYQDRAAGILYLDPLLSFTMGAQVLEAIPVNQINLADYGLEENWTKVTVKDIHNNVAASYKIGIGSAWKHREITQDSRGQNVTLDIPTVYVLKENTEDDNILYLVADPTYNIHSLFKNNFEGFRDHRPFALNRRHMEEIRIKQGNREIVLDHSSPQSPWRISKPLDLRVDSKALSKLLVDISNLTAVKLHQKDSVTLPQEQENLTQIIIKNFGSEKEISLTVYPPADEDAKTAFAVVSDREVIFELPTQSLEGYKSSISSMPNSVNALRARNMLTLARANIRGFVLRQPHTQPIIVARPAAESNYELLAANGTKMAPNETTIANLIAVISKEPVKSFVSDAATDLTIYGFHNPILTLDIRPLAGASRRLFFSRIKDRIYTNLQGKSVVWEIDIESYLRIARNEWEWKSNIIWDLNKSDIVQFTTQHRNQEKTTVNYDYAGDTITANLGTENVSEKINPLQVKYFTNTCSHLTARRRLGPNNLQAKKALENPIFTASITIQTQDLETTELTHTTHSLNIAKASETTTDPAFYYAKSSNDPDYFMITPSTYKLFTTDLFSEE